MVILCVGFWGFFLICQSLHEYCHKLPTLNMNTAMLLKVCCSEGLSGPLEDNSGAPTDLVAVGSSLKYLRFFVFWNLKPMLFFLLKAQTLRKRSVVLGFFPPKYFSFKNDLLKGKKNTLLHSSLCEHPLAYSCDRATCVQMCMSSGYHKWCISQLDLTLDVLLMDSRRKSHYLKVN